MKKSFLYLAIFFCSASLYSAEPLVKFYLNDGSTKQYNLSEIESFGVIDKKNNYVMRIHYDDTLIAYYPTEIIGSIKFENDSLKRKMLNVYIFNYPKSYKKSSIDSIIINYDIYEPLTIGSQVWMLKNLNVAHFRNGDSIPEVKDSTIWRSLKTGAWCYYNNSDSIGKIYGKLYNGYTIFDTRGLAPLGWHVASTSEWRELEDYLGGRGVGYGKIKETGTVHWDNPNKGATNESGFSAIPGGACGGFIYRCEFLGIFGYWWTSKEDGATGAWCIGLDGSENRIDIGHSDRTGTGFSVRCIKNK